jgi:hypothetical protein
MGGKRRRGAEDEVFLDNYHSHKRYLTEVEHFNLIMYLQRFIVIE